MSKTAVSLLASAAQTATAQGGAVPVSNLKGMAVVVDVTSSSGSLSVFLQTSMDGTNWADIPYDLCLQNAPTTITEGRRMIGGVNTTQSTGNNLGDAGCRNIVDGQTGVARRGFARYTLFGNSVRAAWAISGSGATHTFSVLAVGEN